MIINFLKIAFRSLGKHKLFTAINIAGLAMSMSLGLLILTVISDLLSFDKFHVNRNDIFRINTNVKYAAGYADTKATCPFPVADELQNNYQGFKNVTRIQRFFGGKTKTDKKEIDLNGYFTEPSFLQMFSFDLTRGEGPSVLSKPNSVVLTNSSAEKLFGSEDPVGKLVSVGDLGDYMITGIINDPPTNSHLQFDMLGSFSTLSQLENAGALKTSKDKWNELFSNYVYVQREPGLNESKINEELLQIAKKGNAVLDDKKISFEIQSLNKIIPGPDISSQIGPKMSFLPIAILSGVALLILISACINYTNLSLARSLRRAREIGVRKAIGGTKKQLFGQFLVETFAVTILSLIVAYFIFTIVRPEFLKVVPRAGEMYTLRMTPLLVLAFIGFACFTALIAGVLPATILSKFNVIQSLKHDTTIKALGRINLRKALIVFQFTLSLIFIVGVVVIYRQYKFSMNYDPGFASENRMVVPLEGLDYDLFKNEFQKNSSVTSVTGSSNVIGGAGVNAAWVKFPGNNDSIRVDHLRTDENFIKDLGLTLLAGNAFSPTTKPKESTVIINEQMTAAVGAKNPKEALGKLLVVNDEEKEVIGVIKDFNYAHLEEPIRNFMLSYDQKAIGYAYLGISGSYNENMQRSFKNSWANIAGSSVFEGKTMDAFAEETYAYYNNFIKIFGFVAFLAIVIGCLGLIGMSLYAAQSRFKEVGIRKVMGASVANILFLLSKGFAWLLLIAAAIALPLSYFLFSTILENGVYHIRIGLIELGIGFLFLLFTGGITIISQVWKTAASNPVRSLRTE